MADDHRKTDISQSPQCGKSATPLHQGKTSLVKIRSPKVEMKTIGKKRLPDDPR
jgi:hypothetical protein